MEILIKGAQLILSLSILVTLHELGHYLPAKWFKTRVEKFYLFFDPWFSLVKKKIGDTEFGIGWIPFGGYVKISGMVDESMDKAQMAKPAEPWEFRSKPAWQRLIIMVGGVTVNLLLGMAIYIGILWVWGRDYLPIEQLHWGVHPSQAMSDVGVQEGDRPVAINGERQRSLGDLNRALTKSILQTNQAVVTVERAGATVEIVMRDSMQARITKHSKQTHFTERKPFVVDTIIRGGYAQHTSLAKGDSIVGLDGIATPFFYDYYKAAQARQGKWVVIQAMRDGRRQLHVVRLQGTGIGPRRDTSYFSYAHESFGLGASIPAGIESGIETLGMYVSSLKVLFTPDGAGQIGGFGAIGGLFSPTWNWQVFWSMTAFLSIILAFMNILPIPALDGGHVVFLLYEMVTGRPPHQRVLEVAQMIGMVLLLGLILFANGNDLLKAIFK